MKVIFENIMQKIYFHNRIKYYSRKAIPQKDYNIFGIS